MERKALDEAYHLNMLDFLFPPDQPVVRPDVTLPQYVSRCCYAPPARSLLTELFRLPKIAVLRYQNQK